MNNITVKDLLNRKVHLELHLLNDIKERVTAFKKDTGVSIDSVHVIIDKVDTTRMGGGREHHIYGMIDVEVGLDLREME